MVSRYSLKFIWGTLAFGCKELRKMRRCSSSIDTPSAAALFFSLRTTSFSMFRTIN